MPFRSKIFGLTISPDRLAEIRSERRPNSKYASIENCRAEVAEAETMMRRAGIRWLSTTTKSIEEIATTILRRFGRSGWCIDSGAHCSQVQQGACFSPQLGAHGSIDAAKTIKSIATGA